MLARVENALENTCPPRTSSTSIDRVSSNAHIPQHSFLFAARRALERSEAEQAAVDMGTQPRVLVPPRVPELASSRYRAISLTLMAQRPGARELRRRRRRRARRVDGRRVDADGRGAARPQERGPGAKRGLRGHREPGPGRAARAGGGRGRRPAWKSTSVSSALIRGRAGSVERWEPAPPRHRAGVASMASRQ